MEGTTAAAIITALHMQPHPEGGWYVETYRSRQRFMPDAGNGRTLGTAIFYLLENEHQSHFHRLDADELWFFHTGMPIEIYCLTSENGLRTIRLGNNLNQGEVLQCLIPAGVWFAAAVADAKGFALVSCTVFPGFEFSGFELADRDSLLLQFPAHAGLIKRFTR